MGRGEDVDVAVTVDVDGKDFAGLVRRVRDDALRKGLGPVVLVAVGCFVFFSLPISRLSAHVKPESPRQDEASLKGSLAAMAEISEFLEAENAIIAAKDAAADAAAGAGENSFAAVAAADAEYRAVEAAKGVDEQQEAEALRSLFVGGSASACEAAEVGRRLHLVTT